jgi:serine/threonine protein kinase
LVQQYIPGASVQQLLRHGKRFTETEVRKMAADVLEILTYLHNLNPPVLHRDIKPSNLILGDDGQVYLVDFGAVQNSAAAEGVTFTVVGTTGYAPLEQFWGKTVPASDLYALGATLIHLLTGTAPADLPQQNLRIQFRDRISLNPQFSQWIESLTAPALEQRFTNASDALEALHTNRYPKTLLSTISKPAGSQVRLKKSPTQLSIKIPIQKRSLLDIIKLGANLILTAGSLPLMLWLGVAIISLVIAMFIALFNNNSFGFFMLLLLILVLASLWIATSKEFGRVQDNISQTIRNIFGCYYLKFDSKHFVIKRKVFGLSYLKKVNWISDIKKIKKIPFAELTIQTRMTSYSFAQELTESEREWLFQEIRDWLNYKD